MNHNKNNHQLTANTCLKFMRSFYKKQNECIFSSSDSFLKRGSVKPTSPERQQMEIVYPGFSSTSSENSIKFL